MFAALSSRPVLSEEVATSEGSRANRRAGNDGDMEAIKPCDDPELPQAAKGDGHRAGETGGDGAEDTAMERRLDEKIKSELHVSRVLFLWSLEAEPTLPLQPFTRRQAVVSCALR